MSNTVQYWFDQEETNKKQKKELSENIINIRDLFRLLSTEEKLIARRIIIEEDIF